MKLAAGLSQGRKTRRATPSRQFGALLSVLLASPTLAADGGYDSPIYAGCEEWRDAGPAVETDAGWLVPQRRMDLTKCRLASCNEALREPTATPAGYLVVGAAAFGLGVIAGAVALAFVRR